MRFVRLATNTGDMVYVNPKNVLFVEYAMAYPGVSDTDAALMIFAKRKPLETEKVECVRVWLNSRLSITVESVMSMADVLKALEFGDD